MPTAVFAFDVDLMPIDRMISAVNRAVSPVALTAFLEGPVQEYFAYEIEYRFATEGDGKLGFWAPLADATNEIRMALGYPPVTPINERTGKLKEYLTTSYELWTTMQGAAIQIPGDPPNKELEDKLKTAQMGSNSNPIPGFGPTPARPVLGLDEMDLAAVMDLLVHDIVGSVESQLI